MERREAHPFNSRLAACASLAKDARPAALHRGDFCPRDRNFRARTKGGESCPDRGGRSPPVRARKLRSRGQKSPRWSAAGRASFAKDAHAARRELNGCASRRSIPSVLQRDTSNARRKPGEVTAYPAPQRIRAMALGYLKTYPLIPGREQSERTRNPEKPVVPLWIPGPALTRRPGMTK